VACVWWRGDDCGRSACVDVRVGSVNVTCELEWWPRRACAGVVTVVARIVAWWPGRVRWRGNRDARVDLMVVTREMEWWTRRTRWRGGCDVCAGETTGARVVVVVWRPWRVFWRGGRDPVPHEMVW
jgi:hypothetical protein